MSRYLKYACVSAIRDSHRRLSKVTYVESQPQIRRRNQSFKKEKRIHTTKKVPFYIVSLLPLRLFFELVPGGTEDWEALGENEL